jgi:kojibiose phosphorylase
MNYWLLKQNDYNYKENSFYETIFALTNGYVGVRATLEFESEYSAPGIYFSNIYDYGISVPNQIVNAPNWLDIKITIDDEQINFDYVKIIDFNRVLDLRKAFLSTTIKFEDSKGRITIFIRNELLHTKYKNIYIVYGEILSENYSGVITFESCINSSSGNSYHGGYAGRNVKSYHWDNVDSNISQNNSFVIYKTKRTGNLLAVKSTFNVSAEAQWSPLYENKRKGVRCTFYSKQGVPNNFSKLTAFTSGESKKVVEDEVNEHLNQALRIGINSLTNLHFELWDEKWNNLSLGVNGDDLAVQGLLYSTFQLLQCDNSDFFGVNIPARGLTSEYHHGHFFFNTELYMIPFYSWFIPELAKSLLFYRINTRDNALDTSSKHGYKGVFWSEESDLQGLPAGPITVSEFIAGEKFEEWTGRLVKHISPDVAYAIYTYVSITGDKDFEKNEAMKLLPDIARFCISILEWNEKKGYYEINNVIGPDEYHVGVNNNFYTNEIVRWAINYAICLIEKYESESCYSHVDDKEIQEWKRVVLLIKKPNRNSQRVFEQFDGYFDLEDKSIINYRKNGLPLMDSDMAEDIFKFANVSNKIIKQCDVIMFLSMFLDSFSPEEKQANLEFYDKKTMHESSLSTSHAGIVAGNCGNTLLSYKYFLISSRFNLDFEPRENYNNGLHLAAFAGAWLILLYGFLRIEVKSDCLCINPKMPEQITCLNFIFNFLGNRIEIFIDTESLILKMLKAHDEGCKVLIGEETRVLNNGEIVEIS